MLNYIIELLLKYNKIAWLLFIVRNAPEFLKENSELNLWHLACKYQIKELILFANEYGHLINSFDKRGFAPIHQLIESSFYLDNSLVKFNMNIDFLTMFLSYKPDINLKWKIFGLNEKRMYSKTNITGTPIEVLIYTFWTSMAIKSRDDLLDYYPLYEKVFLLFCEKGADINFVSEGQDFGKNDVLQDAMQKLNNTVISHFFIKFIEGNKDLYVIKPFFKNTNTDFSITDNHGNNLLHYFFSRISKQYDRLEEKLVQDIIFDICENINFDKKSLEEKNIFGNTALNSLRGESGKCKKIFERIFLSEKMEELLEIKKETNTKRNKI